MKSDAFSSRVGVVLAAAGGAVGLGNIWKFPYILGQNGGGAFLLVYILCVALFGVPLMMEFMMGKRSGKFCVLPMVFDQMAGGMFFAMLFFALLTIAAVTSAMSLIEMQTAFLYDWSRARTERRALAGNTDIPRSLSRHDAIIISSVCSLLVAFVCTWSMSNAAPWLTWGGVTAFDWVDRFTSRITLPLIAFWTVIFFGWLVSREVMVSEMRLYHGVKPWNIIAYRFLIRWFIPIIIILIFLNGIGAISL